MKQLIQITTIPIAYELQIEKARVEHHEGTANLEISGKQGEPVQIKSQPIKLNLDTYESGNSILSGVNLGVGESGKGLSAVYQATVSMDSEGQLLLKGKISDNLNKMNTTKLSASDENASVNQADLTIRYQMDKMNFDMKVANGNFEFVPGNISIEITQYPGVQIEYVGGPIYVPPSADPSYESVDVKA